MNTAPPLVEGTRERILRCADQLLAKHGYAGMSMREVAVAAGVTKPALYYHFRDKEALFEECVAASQARLSALLQNATRTDGPLEERIEAAALVLLTAYPHHPARVQADIAEHLGEDAVARLGRGFQEAVTEPIGDLFGAAAANGLLREGVSSGLAAEALLGLAAAFLPPAGFAAANAADRLGDDVRGESSDPRRVAGIVTEIVLRGVVATPSPSEVDGTAAGDPIHSQPVGLVRGE
jgi:AcrR family transcriptional regulator